MARRAAWADRLALAEKRVADVEGRRARLTVVVAEAARPGLEIRRDGEAMDAALVGVAAPVDPGPHAIEAAAPGCKGWRPQAGRGGGRAPRGGVPPLEALPVERRPDVVPPPPRLDLVPPPTPPSRELPEAAGARRGALWGYVSAAL